MKSALRALAFLAVSACAQAGMIGDMVSSILHTAAAGSWSGGAGPESATVSAGIEFDRPFAFANGTADLNLNIANTSFTLTFTNNLTGTPGNPTGSFNLGLDGFEFTDLAQQFTGIVPVSNTFPAGSVTSTSVTGNNIHIFMNEPIIPGGTTWAATWNVTVAAPGVPEPTTISLAGLAVVALAVRLRKLVRLRARSIESKREVVTMTWMPGR
jgi:hypothetical protein